MGADMVADPTEAVADLADHTVAVGSADPQAVVDSAGHLEAGWCVFSFSVF